MKSILSLTLFLALCLFQLGVEAKKKDADGPPKRLKVETTFTPATCNRKSRKSKTGDRLKVNYSGRYWKDPSTIIDSNFKSGKPYEFNLGLGNVIVGWDRGLTKMCVGEKRVLTIPAGQTNRISVLAPASGMTTTASPRRSTPHPLPIPRTSTAARALLACASRAAIVVYEVIGWNEGRVEGEALIYDVEVVGIDTAPAKKSTPGTVTQK